MTVFLWLRDRFVPRESWSRIHWVLLAVVFVVQSGFYLSNPFIPLFVRELGVSEVARAAFWSGILIGSGALIGSLSAPVIGLAADRLGGRRVLLAMLISNAVLLLLTSVVTNVWQLLALRLFNGVAGGISPLVMAMSSRVAPAEKIARVVGSVSAFQFLPLAISPALGGFIASAYGIRATFIVGGSFCLVAAAFLLRGVRDDGPAMRSRTLTHDDGPSLRQILRTAGFLAGLTVVFSVQFGETSWFPILPLRLAELMASPADVQIGTGLFYAAGAVAYGVGTWIAGLVEARGVRPLAVAIAGAAAASLFAGLAADPLILALARISVAAFGGIAMTLGYAAVVRQFRGRETQTGFGVLWSGALLGRGVSPFAAGLVAQFGLVAAFFLDAALYVFCLLCVLSLTFRSRTRARNE